MKTNYLFATTLSIVWLAASLITAEYALPNQGASDNLVVDPPKKATTYTVNPEQSAMTWNARKIGGEHNGIIKLAKGELTLDGAKLTGGNFLADMTTMRDTDKSEPNERLMKHLKSDDFFGVEKNPTSAFKITKVTPIRGAKDGEANFTVNGDLTIKGITKPQSFPAVVKVTGNAVEATAKLAINRIDYDIKYRAALIGTAADKIIEDTFSLDLKIVAGKVSL